MRISADPATRDLVLDTAPSAQLVSLEAAKSHLRLDGVDAHDARVTAALAGAVGALDGYSGILGRALAEQTWILYLDRFPTRHALRLPLPPLLSVESITYLDPDGVSHTWAADQYDVLDGERAEIRPAWGVCWPSTRCVARAVAITFTCGWTAPAGSAAWPAKLQPVISAIKLMVEQEFSGFDEARDRAIRSLLRPLTIPRI